LRANYIPALILGTFSLILFRLLYLRAKSMLPRVLLMLTAFILAVPSVLFASNYLLYIPYAPWFYEFHSWAGAEISSGLIGALLGIMFASSKLRPGKLNGSILIVCCVLSFTLLTTPFMKQLYDSVDYTSLTDTWKDGICLQTSSYTCVPACSATMVRLLGGNVTEVELAESAGTIKSGTEYWYLMRALRKRGYEPAYRHYSSLKDAPIPCILGVHIGNLGHVVVLLKKNKDGIVIGEPLSGKKEYTYRQFDEFYHPDKSYITLRRRRMR